MAEEHKLTLEEILEGILGVKPRIDPRWKDPEYMAKVQQRMDEHNQRLHEQYLREKAEREQGKEVK